MKQFPSVLRVTATSLVITAALLVGSTAWCQSPTAPKLIKLPVAFYGMMEQTPIVHKGRLLLVANHRDDTKQKTGEYIKGCSLFILDLLSGEEISRFGEGFSFVSAFVENDEVNVFASQASNDDWFKSIYRLVSTDLKAWKCELAIPLENDEHLFNSSVCKDEQGYLMAYESNQPVQFCFKFARSKDLSHWTKIPGVVFTGEKHEYSACPVIRFLSPYYYVIYLHQPIEGHNGYVSFVARTKDLETWEISGVNPILEAGKFEGINNSDVDLIEWEGNTYFYYASGNQQDWATLRIAMYRGSMQEFFEACFPAEVPVTVVSAKEN